MNSVILSVFLVIISADFTDQACDTRNTTDGNCCAFPFTFNGTTYYDCITEDKGSEWCSLDENYEKHGAWGYCGR